MAKKKPADEKPKDQHKSSFVVRLPEEHREKIAKLVAKHRRPITVEVQIALEKHYKAEGIE